MSVISFDLATRPAARGTKRSGVWRGFTQSLAQGVDALAGYAARHAVSEQAKLVEQFTGMRAGSGKRDRPPPVGSVVKFPSRSELAFLNETIPLFYIGRTATVFGSCATPMDDRAASFCSRLRRSTLRAPRPLRRAAR
jgi:hypothetical protein